MKTYLKSILRSVKSNVARFISIIVIMTLGIAFVAGLGTLSPTIKDSFSVEMDRVGFYDIIVKSTQSTGFTQETVDAIQAMPQVKVLETRTSIDIMDAETRTRIYVYDGFDPKINTVELLEGEYPDAANEVLVERGSNELPTYTVGEETQVFGMTYQVVGVLGNSLIYDCFGEPFINPDTREQDGHLEKIVYFDREFCRLPFPKTDVYIQLSGMGERDFFSDDYMDVLADGKWEAIFAEKPEVLTREERRAWLDTMDGVALGSDAFFPFGDNIERAKRSGVSYIAEPGGSIRDDVVIDTCNKYGMVMAFTGMRLFHH